MPEHRFDSPDPVRGPRLPQPPRDPKGGPTMPEHRFDTPDPVELRVTIPSGEISVETVDGDETVVTVEGTPKLVEQTTVEQRGGSDRGRIPGQARRDLDRDRQPLLRRRPPRGPRPRSALEPGASEHGVGRHVPRRQARARSRSRAVSGDIRANGEIEGDATVKTVSGDLRLATVGGDLRVQSVSGDTTVRSVGGSLEAKSVSGDVRVESVRNGHANATSISGDIEIGIAAGSNVDVDANSVSGDLSSEVALANDPGAAGFGDGPTVVVRGKTVSGDFRVFRAA